MSDADWAVLIVGGVVLIVLIAIMKVVEDTTRRGEDD